MVEIWKEIVGNENDYLVSNTGKVKNIHNGNVLKNNPCKNGYLKVDLRYEKKRTVLVHRLVAEAFLSNPNKYPQVNHKDENKHNNCVDNLEWCDAKYNVNYGENSKIRNSRVMQCDMDGNVIKIFESIKEASRELNIIEQSISMCCRGVRKTASGYRWCYANIDNLFLSKHKWKGN